VQQNNLIVISVMCAVTLYAITVTALVFMDERPPAEQNDTPTIESASEMIDALNEEMKAIRKEAKEAGRPVPPMICPEGSTMIRADAIWAIFPRDASVNVWYGTLSQDYRYEMGLCAIVRCSSYEEAQFRAEALHEVWRLAMQCDAVKGDFLMAPGDYKVEVSGNVVEGGSKKGTRSIASEF